MKIRKSITLWEIENPKVYVMFRPKATQEFLRTIVNKFGTITEVSKLIKRETFSSHFQSYLKNKSFMQLEMVKRILYLLPKRERLTHKRRLEKNIEKIKMSTVSKHIRKPKFPFKLSPLLIITLGNVIAEGYVETRLPIISYTNKETILHDEFKRRMKQIFGDVEFYEKENINNVIETRYPTIVGTLIEELIGRIPKNLELIPRLISNLKPSYQKMFLESLFDEEGYVIVEKYQIGIEMQNLQIIKLSKRLLLKFGIKTGKIGPRPQRTGTVLYEFRISGRENLEKFKSKIGLMHPKKKLKLNSLLNVYKLKRR